MALLRDLVEHLAGGGMVGFVVEDLEERLTGGGAVAGLELGDREVEACADDEDDKIPLYRGGNATVDRGHRRECSLAVGWPARSRRARLGRQAETTLGRDGGPSLF